MQRVFFKLSLYFIYFISSLIWKNTVTESEGVGHAVEFVREQNVDVILGSPASAGKCIIVWRK